MKKVLKFYGLWIVVWMLLIGAAVVDIFMSHSMIDILTIIGGILMIYYNYNSYRKMIPKNGDVLYGQI